MRAYYNEIDQFCAEWLRNLMAAGLIPEGEVDARDIRDVKAGDLSGFDQCHFFAGIAGWPLALRLAEWPDDAPVWTGSCPCQPLSSAGQRKGHADERHLWPAFHALIAECCPPTVFGEQVASKDGREWLAGVRADLEHLGYAVGAADLPAACVGAPHIRQRLWWVAHAEKLHGSSGRDNRRGHRQGLGEISQSGNGCDAGFSDGGLANTGHAERRTRHRARNAEGWDILRQERQEGSIELREHGAHGGLALSNGRHASPEGLQRSGKHGFEPEDGGSGGGLGDAASGRRQEPQERNGEPQDDTADGHSSGTDVDGPGFWSSAILIPCADGKARRVEPGIQPLAHGVPARVGRLRAYGNAIVPQVGAEFVRAFMECRP